MEGRMEGKPPPYANASSSQASTTTKEDDNETALVFVEFLVDDRSDSLFHSHRARLLKHNNCVYHAQEKKKSLGNGRRNLIELIEIEKGLGYTELVDRLTAPKCKQMNLDRISRGWYKSKVRVSDIGVVWEGLFSDMYVKGKRQEFVTWVNGKEPRLQNMLKKMDQRGWKDRLIVELDVEGEASQGLR